MTTSGGLPSETMWASFFASVARVLALGGLRAQPEESFLFGPHQSFIVCTESGKSPVAAKELKVKPLLLPILFLRGKGHSLLFILGPHKDII